MGFSSDQLAQLQAELEPGRVAKRQGSGSMQLSYLEGYDVINAANRIFGFDGWQYRVTSLQEAGDGIVTALVRVNVLTDTGNGFGAYIEREDVGIGTGATTAAGKEKAYKEAVTDGLKRALRSFGDQFGNSLYDKTSDLHRTAGSSAPATTKGPAKKAPAVVGGTPQVDPSEYPAPNDGKGGYVCADCATPIVDSNNYPAGKTAALSVKAKGSILCLKCRFGNS